VGAPQKAQVKKYRTTGLMKFCLNLPKTQPPCQTPVQVPCKYLIDSANGTEFLLSMKTPGLVNMLHI